VPVDCGQCRRQPRNVWKDRIGATPEDIGKVFAGVLIDGNAEHADSGLAGFADGYSCILNAVAAFIMVDVVGLAVGED